LHILRSRFRNTEIKLNKSGEVLVRGQGKLFQELFKQLKFTDEEIEKLLGENYKRPFFFKFK